MSTTDVTATPGAKMTYLIRRRPTISREELVAHWFANHMPLVIAGQHERAEAGKLHASRYVATLFDPGRDGAHVWDGMAQLWWDRPLPRVDPPHGTEPTDSFQQRAEPYVGWPTTEYVVIDDVGRLPVEPLTLNDPYPTTRSGFVKKTFLVRAKADTDHGAFFAHWLDVHAPNVRGVMQEVGGFRYVISHSIEPDVEPYAGMAELYFPDEDAWRGFRDTIEPDGMERWTEPGAADVMGAHTEMIGIP